MRTELSDTARAALERIERLAREGFTGEVVIQFAEGGVRTMKAGTLWTGKDLVRQAGNT